MKKPVDIEYLLGEVFDDLRDGLADSVGDAKYAEMRRDFIFHMLDWQSDLKGLYELTSHPERFSREDASRFVTGLLYHVIPHLNTAGRLLLDGITDPFAGDHVCGKPEQTAKSG